MKLETFITRVFIQALMFSLVGVVIVACIILARDISEKRRQLESFLDDQAKWIAPELGLSIQKGELESTKLMLKFIEANQRGKGLMLNIQLNSGEDIGNNVPNAHTFEFQEIAFSKGYAIKWGVEKVGLLKLGAKENLSYRTLMKFPLVLLLFLVSSHLASFLLLYFGLKKQLSIPIADFISKLALGDSSVHVHTQIFEIQKISRVFHSYLESIKNSNQKNIELERRNAIAETQNMLARQVAHDIRSPLSVLVALSYKFRERLPDESKMIDTVTARISGIANDLLDSSRNKLNEDRSNQFNSKPSSPVTTFCKLSDIRLACAETMAEKKIQLGAESKIDLSLYDEISGDLKISCDSANLRRIISNLLNNSIEAIAAKGFVSITLSSEFDRVLIEIRDSGSGMTQELVDEAFVGPVSKGKARGNGLGLNPAIRIVETWGGKFKIRSSLGQGTTISISLLNA